MGLSNDERGWVMTCLSGIACVLGASIICIDLIIRQFPGKAGFRIQDSDTFLSVSLSLSFGVMLFSALYSMLPSSKNALIDGGFSPKAASWILIGCFIGGVLGIQVISRVMHQFIPSHIVDCEHSHEDEPKEPASAEVNSHSHDDDHPSPPPRRPQTPRKSSLPGHFPSPGGAGRRRAPARESSSYFSASASGPAFAPTAESEANSNPLVANNKRLKAVHSQSSRRPSLHERVTSTITQIASTKPSKCDCNGPCYGYSEPCGQECFRNVNARGGYRSHTMRSTTMKPSLTKRATAGAIPTAESTPLLQDISEDLRPQTDHIQPAPTRYYTMSEDPMPDPADDSSVTLEEGTTNGNASLHKTHSNETTSSHNPDHHHHHVPTNAFLSIGLQTSIAIALHKLPEGFITYATNHANPKLGFSVFLALFIHNITEGFAMALPLYLAINSRVKAMLISFVLGGLSQPIGAAVAAIWFKLAGNGKWQPSEGVYGGMFAVTAGIMASVALQLFSESLDLTHSKNLCFVGAFVGMGVLGVSSALTA